MKTTKKLLSIVLTTMLSLCMVTTMATTAFAASTPIGITAADTSQEVTKNWTAASLSQMNDTEEFTFTLQYDKAEQINTSIPTATPQLNGSDMSAKTVTITDTWLTQATAAGTPSATGSLSLVSLFSGVTFSAPGVYTFDLFEDIGANANINYNPDGDIYTITVVVGYALDGAGSPTEELSIVSVTTAALINDEDVKTDPVFKNTPVETEDLTVFKTVKGKAANVNDYFAFTVTLTGGATGTYAITTDSAYATNPATITVGTAATIYLKHGESFSILNLPVGAEYTITENYGTYTPSFKVNGGTETEGYTVSDEIARGENTCEFINTKNPPSITGYFMDILPFTLLFGTVIAGTVIFFVVRRRRREEHLGDSF